MRIKYTKSERPIIPFKDVKDSGLYTPYLPTNRKKKITPKQTKQLTRPTR